MKKCHICIRDVYPFRKYCGRCRRFVYRAGNKRAHVAALIRDYDPVHDVFRCHRTHVALEENDPKSPKYLTFDHSEPGVETPENLFLTMAVLNESKTDMTWPEYVAFAREIVRANDTGEFDEKVLEFKHWYRLVRRGRKGRGRKALGKNARGKRARGKKR